MDLIFILAMQTKAKKNNYYNNDNTNIQLYFCIVSIIRKNFTLMHQVCLSLLGTWAANSPEEEWQPNKSTFGNVAVSIQGMILVRRLSPTTKNALWCFHLAFQKN